MATPRKYFHDHLVLLLLSINIFLAVVGSLYFLIRLGTSHGSSYIVQYRSAYAINKFPTGTVYDLLAFVAFAALVLAINSVLSYRAYYIHRQVAIMILSLGILLLVMTSIVSNALLVLR
jgi:hypothetical protein